MKKVSTNKADEKQSTFYKEIKRVKHGRRTDEKKFKNLEFLFHGRGTALYDFNEISNEGYGWQSL